MVISYCFANTTPMCDGYIIFVQKHNITDLLGLLLSILHHLLILIKECIIQSLRELLSVYNFITTVSFPEDISLILVQSLRTSCDPCHLQLFTPATVFHACINIVITCVKTVSVILSPYSFVTASVYLVFCLSSQISL